MSTWLCPMAHTTSHMAMRPRATLECANISFHHRGSTACSIFRLQVHRDISEIPHQRRQRLFRHCTRDQKIQQGHVGIPTRRCTRQAKQADGYGWRGVWSWLLWQVLGHVKAVQQGRKRQCSPHDATVREIGLVMHARCDLLGLQACLSA